MTSRHIIGFNLGVLPHMGQINAATGAGIPAGYRLFFGAVQFGQSSSPSSGNSGERRVDAEDALDQPFFSPAQERWLRHPQVGRYLLDKAMTPVPVRALNMGGGFLHRLGLFKKEQLDRQLLYAVFHKHLNTIPFLHAAGANLEMRDGRMRTPIFWAAEFGDVETVRLLHELGANVDAKDRQGMTPFMWAIHHERFEMAETLLELGADIDEKNASGYPAVIQALHLHHPRALQFLAEHHADLCVQDNNLMTPLMWATLHGDPDGLKLLQDFIGNLSEADLKSGQVFKDVDGTTDLMWAVHNNETETVEFLAKMMTRLKQQDMLDAKDKYGMTALMWAVHWKHPRIVKILGEYGADVNMADRHRAMTPLMWAAFYGEDETAKHLIGFRGRIELDRQDHENWTALIWASYLGRETMARALVAAGANAAIEDEFGKNAAYYARKGGHTELADVLEQAARLRSMAGGGKGSKAH